MGTDTLTARGRSLEGRVTAKRGWILGGDDERMLIHWEESATTKTAPFRRNPLGAGGPPTFQTEAAGAPQALSGILKPGHDVKTAPAASVIDLGGRSSLRTCNPKTPARGPRDFCHGLLTTDMPAEGSFRLDSRSSPVGALCNCKQSDETSASCGHRPQLQMKQPCCRISLHAVFLTSL